MVKALAVVGLLGVALLKIGINPLAAAKNADRFQGLSTVSHFFAGPPENRDEPNPASELDREKFLGVPAQIFLERKDLGKKFPGP